MDTTVDPGSDFRAYARFENKDEFIALRDQILALDIYTEPSQEQGSAEWNVYKKINLIFDSYQEQSYLWDPYLESLVLPVVEKFKAHAKRFASGEVKTASFLRLQIFSGLPYLFVKFRGYKTITKFFPHEIADLTIALDCMTNAEDIVDQNYSWSFRYILLLWLSLVCMIPFDLEQFDEAGSEGKTAVRVEAVGKSFLAKAGLDREAAALLLSKFYMRKDTASKFPDFLSWSIETVGSVVDPFPVIGLLRVLCEVAKLGSTDQVQTCKEKFLQAASTLQGNTSLMGNTLIRQLRIKLIARVVIRLLPARTRRLRAKGRALAMEGGFGAEAVANDDYFDVPEEIESVLEDLFKALRDKDTVVRYSAAKGVARVSERLPTDFAEQVLDQVLHLFSLHSAGIASIYDLPSIAEATWHGACLACAEMTRRALIPDERLSELVQWLYKALLFDIRKGAHSIGSNVRDAASYVLWSLARAQGVDGLRPHALELARILVTVSCFDREIPIRRAASAAYQEFVGRTNLFPHGIDVLRKTDFYAVGVRRNAFTVAAPEVAEHEEYRGCLIDHLLNVTLRHWDPAMREIGAQSLRYICELDLAALGPEAAKRAAQLLTIPDDADVHGGLLALTEFALAFRNSPQHEQLEPERRKIFTALSTVPLTTIQSSRQELIAAAACNLIASGISFAETQHAQATVPHWRQVVDSGLKNKSAAVQEAAASALAAVSRLVDCSAVVNRLIREFEGKIPPMQQSLARVLGVLDYATFPHGVQDAVRCLLRMVDRKSGSGSTNVEARRNAFDSMPLILNNISGKLEEELSPELVNELEDALLDGLTDYTSDERGDVGSWVRISCVKGLTSFVQTLFSRAGSLPDLASYLPPEKYHDAVGGILKQAVERLDNVRQIAGENFLTLLLLPPPAVPNPAPWKLRGDVRMKELFLSEQESVGWNVGSWVFPRAVQLLDIERYRDQVLAGIVLSASTKTDSTQRPVTSALVAWALQIPVTASEPDRYDLRGLAQDLLGQALTKASSNNVVVPVLQTLNVLLEADVFERLPQDPRGLTTLRSLLSLVTKNASKLKNPQRINVSMRCLINLIPIPELQKDCIPQLSTYLGHQYPRVRADTAEYLYTVLSSKETGIQTDEVEEILLETEWSSANSTMVEEAVGRCIGLMSA
ncbi:ARM repeat-containing protein [Dichomitus squalens LYAD-421 SS1]|uniref:ARM repeat-containing protein n=1 Tax=Dichomitus squalens (strain LYAD-421) TaxID=732165 RepID=UPI00044137CE|nr:ARM repeat-containing protein [Dichomitus squalens LYAD-421 SS1]EJF63417.1 ARM repeat-containing protein [Dichomitus squalens LYAD-421 SS1]